MLAFFVICVYIYNMEIQMTKTDSIKAALSLTVCRGWDRSFLESILEQIEKKRNLSKKQLQMLDKILLKNTPEHQTQHENWASVYETDYKNEGIIVARYYSKQPPYYTDVANDVLNDLVPERVSFFRMMENKYAARILEEYNRDPLYDKSMLVMPRANTVSKHLHFEDFIKLSWPETNKTIEKFKQNGGFVIKVCDEIFSAAKGSKRYKILAIGAKYPFIVEERHIKRKRKH